MFHDEILLVALAEMVAYLWKDGMTHSGENTSFALKRISEHFVTRKKCSLERNRAAQPLVNGKIHLTHTSFPYQLNDKVAILDHRVLSKRFHFRSDTKQKKAKL
jgi:hypothetical protein